MLKVIAIWCDKANIWKADDVVFLSEAGVLIGIDGD